ncbi:MAG: hypothetical protein R6V38_04015 [Roseovarius gahaiensis]
MGIGIKDAVECARFPAVLAIFDPDGLALVLPNSLSKKIRIDIAK